MALMAHSRAHVLRRALSSETAPRCSPQASPSALILTSPAYKKVYKQTMATFNSGRVARIFRAVADEPDLIEVHNRIGNDYRLWRYTADTLFAAATILSRQY